MCYQKSEQAHKYGGVKPVNGTTVYGHANNDLEVIGTEKVKELLLLLIEIIDSCNAIPHLSVYSPFAYAKSFNVGVLSKREFIEHCYNVHLFMLLLCSCNSKSWPCLENVFIGVNVARSFVLCVVSCRSLFVHMRPSPALVGFVLLDLLFSVQCFIDHCLCI